MYADEPSLHRQVKNLFFFLTYYTVLTFYSYLIGGNNYLKLRDIAALLGQTEKKFSVEWDGVNKSIKLTSGMEYVKVGGELVSPSREDKNAAVSSAKLYLDGAELRFSAYNIDGNNYFKLRDICDALGVTVDWDAPTKTVILKTK